VLDGLAVPDELDAVHGLFEQAGQAHPEVDAMDLMLFGTAVIEIANNVVEHGRPLGEVRWRVALSIHDGLIEATLADSGREFTPDLGAAMPGENAESGRGFALAEAVLDEITLDRVDGVNRWHMVRRIAPAQSHP
jgi:serine/threonine-protein kinase RsbW